MGLFDKLLGRADQPSAPRGFDAAAIRPAISDLIEALGSLADAMDTEDAPLTNPGWRGRLRDLRNARGELRMLARKPDFSRDDLFEVLTTVRPLFRGEPPKDFAHLAALNAAVADGIERVHAAAS